MLGIKDSEGGRRFSNSIYQFNDGTRGSGSIHSNSSSLTSREDFSSTYSTSSSHQDQNESEDFSAYHRASKSPMKRISIPLTRVEERGGTGDEMVVDNDYPEKIVSRLTLSTDAETSTTVTANGSGFDLSKSQFSVSKSLVEYYHPGRWIQSRGALARHFKWECCRVREKSHPGCQSGPVARYHPLEWDHLMWRCCVDGDRKKDGCQVGSHPLPSP